MNVRPGGKQPRMRDGSPMAWVPCQNHPPWDHPEYPGQAKGLRQVCRERFGDEAVVGLRHEQLAELLKDCEDFRSQPTLLEDEAELRGDRVIFGVKGSLSLYANALRVANSAGSSAGFKERIIECQEPPELTLCFIRKHFRSCREYLQLYSERKSLEEIERLRQTKRKHRGAAPQLGIAAEGSGANKPGKYNWQRL
ncbi:hypothetical protein FOZ62_002103 [Perkinsus olseni]|uniref:Uncharacterized protein n=1 Tax=Perkinsus olseni TaxID=32597 RepID=A0A7J6PX38_PEROL|nr:hypothetical protein FOZ62_002103 [Perkinsus olseni]